MGNYSLIADEPASIGGNDEGPGPYDLLLSSIGACTSMTLQMYAKRKKLPLTGVDVELNHSKIYAADCLECATEHSTKKVQRLIAVSEESLCSVRI